jgi:hypothetical protein
MQPNRKDRSSLARGIPPLIVSSQYDVPVPTVDALCGAADQNSVRKVTATECFVWLCKFTTITQKVLRIAFDLRSSTTDAVTKALRQCQVELDTWEDAFTQWKTECNSHTEIRVPGASNLWLCFLTIKMLLCRIALHVGVRFIDLRNTILTRSIGIRQIRGHAVRSNATIQPNELHGGCA